MIALIKLSKSQILEALKDYRGHTFRFCFSYESEKPTLKKTIKDNPIQEWKCISHWESGSFDLSKVTNISNALKLAIHRHPYADYFEFLIELDQLGLGYQVTDITPSLQTEIETQISSTDVKRKEIRNAILDSKTLDNINEEQINLIHRNLFSTTLKKAV